MNCGTFNYSLCSLWHLIVFNFCSELYVLRKLCYYHPSPNIREGTVSKDACLSFCSEGRRVLMPITHDALDLTVEGPPPDMTHRDTPWPPLERPFSSRLETHSILVQLRTPSSPFLRFFSKLKFITYYSMLFMFIVFNDIRSSYAKKLDLITDALSHFWFKLTVFIFRGPSKAIT